MLILVVGGYGTFGGRLVDLLADDSRLHLIVAGRSAHKAAEFCSRRNTQARLIPKAFDRSGDVAQPLREMEPDVLVDASGPFQSYGERRKRWQQPPAHEPRADDERAMQNLGDRPGTHPYLVGFGP